MSVPQDDIQLRERLRALRVDPPDDGFGAALRQRLVAAGPPRPASPWRAWLDRFPAVRPALAAAAALAVVAAAALWSLPPSRATVLPATKVAVVRLVLAAEVPVEGAHVRVVLPPELAFWADGAELAQRTFEWTQPLAAGANEIPIAVRGSRPGRYRVVVSARIGDQVVNDEVVLQVVKG
jgi:hypothetical protein